MKQSSLYLEFISQLWPKLALYIHERTNGRNGDETTLKYHFKEMLTPVYSVDQKWEGTNANTQYVAADVVALDSPLPVKARPSISKSSGTLPKIGLKRALSETEITAIDTMKAQLAVTASAQGEGSAQVQAQKQRILQKLTNDSLFCAVGIDEKLEAAFLEGLSNGAALITDESLSTSSALRADYGYLADHTIHTATAGTVDDADIDAILAKADTEGNSLQYIVLAQSTFNKLRATTWAKSIVADYRGVNYNKSQAANLPTPSSDAFEQAFADRFNGLKFIKIDRSVLFEKNGKRNAVKPWNANHIVFLTDKQVGSLVWATPVEDNHRVPGVEYANVDQYKLISKFSVNEPLQEWTTGTAIALPIIENVDTIYTLALEAAE